MAQHDPSSEVQSEPVPPGDAAAGDHDADRESPWAFWRGVLITLGVALGVRHFLLEARYIPSGSMLPGLQIQDRLLVEKLTYHQRPPRRGEIVVFHAPHRFDPVLRSEHRTGPLRCLLANLPLVNALPGLQAPACDAYIKRVVAVGGDRVVITPRGDVSVNGRALSEPYVRNRCPIDPMGMGPCRPLSAVVPQRHVLVLGDNRANSWDGRFWPGGPFLPESEIIGRAFWRFWPPATAGELRMDDPLPPARDPG
ncbi:MAG: signal peptidase [Cyanobacteriota bacterium]